MGFGGGGVAENKAQSWGVGRREKIETRGNNTVDSVLTLVR